MKHIPVSAPAAPRCGAPVPGGHCTAPVAPPATAAAAAVVRGPYERHVWEAEVMASSLHRATRHIAHVLAHFGGVAGYLPAGGPQHLERLTAVTGHNEKNCRLSLQQLENARLIWRPPVATWREHQVRPITLTMPPSGFHYQPAGPRRTEPAQRARAAS